MRLWNGMILIIAMASGLSAHAGNCKISGNFRQFHAFPGLYAARTFHTDLFIPAVVNPGAKDDSVIENVSVEECFSRALNFIAQPTIGFHTADEKNIDPSIIKQIAANNLRIDYLDDTGIQSFVVFEKASNQ